MERIFVPYGAADITYRESRQLQKLSRFCHAVADQKLLRGAAGTGAENSSQITSVNTAHSGNIFDRNIILEVLFNKINRFFDILITHFAVGSRLWCRS